MILRKLLTKGILLFLIFPSVIFAKGEITGVSYFDYTYDLMENATNDEGFALTRVYLTYKNDISKDVSFKFQSDIDYKISPANLYLKKAQLNWKSPVGKITLGMQGMNIFNVTEKNWAFRFIEKSPMDKHGFSSSADMGIGYYNRISKFSYNLLITNGVGYKRQEDDKWKKISLQTVYGQKNIDKEGGFNLGTSFSYERYSSGNGPSSIIVGSFFGGLKLNRFRIGGEFERKKNIQTEQIIAFYSSYKIIDNLEGLVYLDMYDPDTDSGGNFETYTILGFNYYPTKGLIISPNFRLTSFESESESKTLFKVNFQFKF